MDAVGSERAVRYDVSEYGAMVLLFAATLSPRNVFVASECALLLHSISRFDLRRTPVNFLVHRNIQVRDHEGCNENPDYNENHK